MRSNPSQLATAILLIIASSGCSDPSAPIAPRTFPTQVDGLSSSASTRFVYNPKLGTLPDAQGFSLTVGSGNALPVVREGILRSSATADAQYSNRFVAGIDFSGNFFVRANVRVAYSNYIASSPTSRSWEGYYLAVADINNDEVDIGIASNGFTVQSILNVNQPLLPFSFDDGNFHIVTLSIHAGVGTLAIDGHIVASGIQPYRSAGFSNVAFGAASSLSRSDTQLKFFCFSLTSSSSCD